MLMQEAKPECPNAFQLEAVSGSQKSAFINVLFFSKEYVKTCAERMI